MLNQIPEGVVWAILFLPLGSFAAISLAALLGLTGSGPSTGTGARWDARLSGYLTIAAITVSFGYVTASIFAHPYQPGSHISMSSGRCNRRASFLALLGSKNHSIPRADAIFHHSF